MSKFLDANGLLYLWGKVTAKLSGKLDKSGGTLTGSLTLNQDPTIDMHAATKKYVDDKTANAGSGDMLRATYDTNGNGVVDNAEKVGGHTVNADVPAGAVFTDTTYSVVAASKDGLMRKEDFSKLAAFQPASDYVLKTDIAGAYRYKGSVADFAALPNTGNETGDVWNAEDTGMNYAWTGAEWDALGQLFTVDAISNADIDTITS